MRLLFQVVDGPVQSIITKFFNEVARPCPTPLYPTRDSCLIVSLILMNQGSVWKALPWLVATYRCFMYPKLPESSSKQTERLLSQHTHTHMHGCRYKASVYIRHKKASEGEGTLIRLFICLLNFIYSAMLALLFPSMSELLICSAIVNAFVHEIVFVH